MADVVLYEVSDRVATVTIDRPEARNALSAEVRRALAEAMHRADAADDVDAVILTGADPAFCAGLDLKELGDGDRGPGSPGTVNDSGSVNDTGSPGSVNDTGSAHANDSDHTASVVLNRPLPTIGKPLIGAVNGVAVTGGLELALTCDFLVASERARFADTHARVGIQPGWGLTVLLPEAVGLRRAKEMSATGNFLDAATALSWGLVNHVVPHDELLPFCRQLATDISSNDQAGVRRIFQTYDEGALLAGNEAWHLEAVTAHEWLRSGGGRPEDIEARRRAVMERGRAQHH